MTDSKYSIEGIKSPKISTEAILKYSVMLKFVPDHPKTKEMCRHVV